MGCSSSKPGQVEGGEIRGTAAAAPHPKVENLGQHYEVIRELGHGKFGVAKLAKDKRTGELVAVKFLPRGSAIDNNVERELAILRTLVHPNLILFREAFLTDTHLGLAMEFAEGGELYDQIAKKRRLSEEDARKYMRQLVAGLGFLHDQSTCHRDLKAENILLDGQGNLKLADFGYAKSAELHSQPHTTVGTPSYVAPEVLNNGAGQYDGYAADVWSTGVLLYTMLVGRYPFENPNNPTDLHFMFRKIIRAEYSIPAQLTLSPEVTDLIKRILVADPTQRITLKEIQEHPWVQAGNGEKGETTSGPMPVQRPQQSESELRVILDAAKRSN